MVRRGLGEQRGEGIAARQHCLRGGWAIPGVGGAGRSSHALFLGGAPICGLMGSASVSEEKTCLRPAKGAGDAATPDSLGSHSISFRWLILRPRPVQKRNFLLLRPVQKKNFLFLRTSFLELHFLGPPPFQKQNSCYLLLSLGLPSPWAPHCTGAAF